MSLTSALLIDMVIKGLYDSQALWNKTNRSYDSLVTSKMLDSVDIPINPQLIVSKEPVARNSASRKKTLGDTGKVNVPFQTYTIALTQEVEERMLMNGSLLNNFIQDCSAALDDQLDADVITSALTTTSTEAWASATLSWKDIVNIDAKLSTLKVPKRNRIVIIPSKLQAAFQDIDVVKNAMAFNQNLLENGVVVINNIQFYFTPQFDSEDTILGIYSQGIATVLKGYMDRQESYDNTTRHLDIDYNTQAAIKLCKNEFAVKSIKP